MNPAPVVALNPKDAFVFEIVYRSKGVIRQARYLAHNFKEACQALRDAVGQEIEILSFKSYEDPNPANLPPFDLGGAQ